MRVVDTIVGFLLGTIIAGLIGYFYGASHITETPPKPPTPPAATTPAKAPDVQPN